MGKANTRSVQRYIDKTYDRMTLRLYKDELASIRAIAAEKGMTVTQYICHAINALGDIQLSPHNKTGVEVLAEKRAAAAEAEAATDVE